MSQETAQRAVDSWQLTGGVARSWECGCRFWISLSRGASRSVYTCPDHRQSWEDADPGFVIGHADT